MSVLSHADPRLEYSGRLHKQPSDNERFHTLCKASQKTKSHVNSCVVISMEWNRTKTGGLGKLYDDMIIDMKGIDFVRLIRQMKILGN